MKSPYIGYKSSISVPLPHTTRAGSRFSRIRSRPQTAIQGIEEIDEKGTDIEKQGSDSPTDLTKVNLNLNLAASDVINTSKSKRKFNLLIKHFL